MFSLILDPQNAYWPSTPDPHSTSVSSGLRIIKPENVKPTWILEVNVQKWLVDCHDVIYGIRLLRAPSTEEQLTEVWDWRTCAKNTKKKKQKKYLKESPVLLFEHFEC